MEDQAGAGIKENKTDETIGVKHSRAEVCIKDIQTD
jgi:hypothetical protein